MIGGPHRNSPAGLRRVLAGIGAPALFFGLVALVFTFAGFLPGRVLVPMDLTRDVGAWKPDPTVRAPVSNSLLSDAVLQFVPWDTQVRRSLATGEMPWSNPYAGRGAALFANPCAAIFSPFTWPRLLFGLGGWALSVFGKLLLSGLGVYWLMRELGEKGAAPYCSGLVFAASGFSVVWGLHPQTNVSAVLPLLAAAVVRFLTRPAWGSAFLIILFAALATAGGHPETLAVGVIAIVAFAGATRRPPVRIALRALACMLAGFLLLGIQLVPFGILLSRSRILEQRSAAAPGSFRTFALVGQVLPGALGSPLRGELDLTGAIPGSENFNMRNQAFIGLLGLLLILLSFRRLPPVWRRGLLIGAGALLLSWRLPGLRSVLRAAPLLSKAAPEYWAFGFVLMAAMAAGPALTSVAASDGGRRAGVGLMVAGAALALAGLAPSLPVLRPVAVRAARRAVERMRSEGLLRQPESVYEARLPRYLSSGRGTAARRLALPGLFWVLGGCGLLARRRRLPILSCALAGELFAFGAGYLPAVPRSSIPADPPALRDLKRLDPGERWMIAADADVYPPNLGTLARVRDIRSYDVLNDRRLMADLRGAGYDELSASFPSTLPPEKLQALARLGVRYFLTRRRIPGGRLAGGGAPPEVGVYELGMTGPAPPMPTNSRPDGLLAGLLVTAFPALAGLVVCFRRGKRVGSELPAV